MNKLSYLLFKLRRTTAYTAQLKAAQSESISPNGFTASLNRLLNITNPTPINAMTDPAIVAPLIRTFLYTIRMSRAVNKGAVVTINETFDTRVYSIAVFSVIKYIDPPQSPHIRNKNSSFSDLTGIRLYVTPNNRI